MIHNICRYVNYNKNSYSIYATTDLCTDKFHISQIMLPIDFFIDGILTLKGILPNDIIRDSRYFILVPSGELYKTHCEMNFSNRYECLVEQIVICTNPRFQLSMDTLNNNFTNIRVDTIKLNALTSSEMHAMSLVFERIMKCNINADTLTKIMYKNI